MKEAYRKFCEANSAIIVFKQPWYLDIVAQEGWDVVLSYGKDGTVQGAWPFIMAKKRGLTFILMPPYTQLLGPSVFYPEHITTNYKRASLYSKVMQDLEKQLPKVDYLNISFDSGADSWFPLYPLQYKQTTRYTYLIEAGQDEQDLLKQIKPQLRNTLSHQSDLGEIKMVDDVTSFLSLLEKTFSGNQIDQFYHEEMIKKLISRAIDIKQGTIYAFDGMPAAIFILKDDHKHYCLFTATTEEGKVQEGVAHLIWRAILDAGKEGKDFDFEGSMLPGVEKFFRSFGGIQMPYHQISKINNPFLRLYKFLKP